jgi:hypothetical protein
MGLSARRSLWALLMAERVGWALRARACGCAAAPVEQGSVPQPHSARKTKGPMKGPFIFLAVERVLRGGCSPAPCPSFPYRRSFPDYLGWGESSTDDALHMSGPVSLISGKSTGNLISIAWRQSNGHCFLFFSIGYRNNVRQPDSNQGISGKRKFLEFFA